MAVDISLMPLAQEESTHKIAGKKKKKKLPRYNEQEIEQLTLITDKLIYSQTLI